MLGIAELALWLVYLHLSASRVFLKDDYRNIYLY
jgi:hypothetical protein